ISASDCAYTCQPSQPPSAAASSNGAIHNACAGGSANGAPRARTTTIARLTRTIHGATGRRRCRIVPRASGGGGMEVEAHVLAGLLDEIALQVVDAGGPQQRGGLRVLDLRRDHAAAAVVRTRHDLAQFFAQRRIAQGGAAVALRELEIV